jgi:hypothetical protein
VFSRDPLATNSNYISGLLAAFSISHKSYEAVVADVRQLPQTRALSVNIVKGCEMFALLVIHRSIQTREEKASGLASGSRPAGEKDVVERQYAHRLCSHRHGDRGNAEAEKKNEWTLSTWPSNAG